MDVNAVLEKIRKMYANGEYVEAQEEIIELQEKQLAYLKKESNEEVIIDRITNIELDLITAKSIIRSASYDNKALLNHLYKMLEAYMNKIQTLSEFAAFEQDLFEAIYAWERPILVEAINQLKTNFTTEAYNAYLKVSISILEIHINVNMHMRNNQNILAIAESAGLFKNGKKEGWEQFKKEYIKESEIRFTNRMEKEMLRGVVNERFMAIKETIEENGHMHREAVIELANVVIPQLCLVKQILKVEADEKINGEYSLESLYAYSEVLRYFLEVVVYPDGNAHSLVQGESREEYEELKEIYKRIQRVNPCFVAPPLPSPDAINAYASKQASSGVGTGPGCLVAIVVLALAFLIPWLIMR